MLFDRFAKLKKAVPEGAVYSGLKQVMPMLRGRLEKVDVPAVVVEPEGMDELRAVIDFAAEKGIKIAVAAGLAPVAVDDLGGQMLILTSRLRGPLEYLNPECTSVRIPAGMAIEELAVELAGAARRWMPIHPVPTGESVGSLIATGWEGFRNWRTGGTLASLLAIEWIGYDGESWVSGPATIDADSPDVSGLLFGTRGKYGIITSVEVELHPLAEDRTLSLFELPSPERAVETMAALRTVAPLPETVVYFGEMATEILRSNNDGIVSPKARTVVVADWPCVCDLDAGLKRYARVEQDPKQVNGMWQDLFRLPRATARLSPDRTTARLKLPTAAIADLEERARDLSRDYNLGVAIWGTTERGYVRLWILQPDGEPRTRRQAEDLLRKLIEDVVRLGGCRVNAQTPEADPLAASARGHLLERCDPHCLHLPLRSLPA